MADNVDITPGAGKTIAADDIGGVLHQRVKLTYGVDGAAADVTDDLPLPIMQRGYPTVFYSSVMAAGAASKIFLDVFNAVGSGKIAKLRGLYVISNSAAVTGVPIQWTLSRTTTVGTGGTVLTAGVSDLSDPAVPAQITARHAAAGGAATGGGLFDFWTTSEETIAANAIAGTINWIPNPVGVQPVVIREGQGVKLTHVTSSTAGSWMVTGVFTLE